MKKIFFNYNFLEAKPNCHYSTKVYNKMVTKYGKWIGKMNGEWWTNVDGNIDAWEGSWAFMDQCDTYWL